MNPRWKVFQRGLRVNSVGWSIHRLACETNAFNLRSWRSIYMYTTHKSWPLGFSISMDTWVYHMPYSIILYCNEPVMAMYPLSRPEGPILTVKFLPVGASMVEEEKGGQVRHCKKPPHWILGVRPSLKGRSFPGGQWKRENDWSIITIIIEGHRFSFTLFSLKARRLTLHGFISCSLGLACRPFQLQTFTIIPCSIAI